MAALSDVLNTTRPRYLRNLWVDGVRANRTIANASAMLGDLQVTPEGYITQHTVPWDTTQAEDTVELVYFQQTAPWQAPRCALRHATGHTLKVAQPCFSIFSKQIKGIPDLPRNHSSGRSGCADDDPGCGGLVGNPLGSGLPLYIENIPLTAPGVPLGSASPGHFWFSPQQQKVWYFPRAHELSKDQKHFVSEVIAPVSEGLVVADGLQGVTFEGISFEHMAWNEPSKGNGFVDSQDGFHANPGGSDSIPGGLDCTNCSNIIVRGCSFARMGGSGVTFGGVAKRVVVESSHVFDVSGNGV